jgi:hypothetical protein
VTVVVPVIPFHRNVNVAVPIVRPLSSPEGLIDATEVFEMLQVPLDGSIFLT